jgi:hypothetical protein
MKGDITSLSVWAQKEIQKRDNKIAILERHVGEMTSQHPNTNVKVHNWLTGPDKDLPPDSSIDFYLAENREKYDRTINVQPVRYSCNMLQITASSFGRYHMVIEPASSNRVFVTFQEDE